MSILADLKKNVFNYQISTVISVLQGYSSLAVALVLPDSGVLVACERDKNSLEVAKRYYDRAGVSHKVICLSFHV